MSNRNNMIPIPGRLHSVAVGEPVSGADEVLDDDLQLTQAQINAIVLGGRITPSMGATPDVVLVNVQSSIALSALISTAVDSIKIKKGSTVLATGSGTSLSGSDTITPSATGDTTYTAEFVLGGLTKNATKKVTAVYPIKYGAGAAYTDATTQASARKTPAGTYNVTVSTAGSYVWFVVPATMTINKATKGGFDFPLESPENVTIGGVAYKAYRSSNTYDAGTEVITLS